jgi:hypothetical protein
MRLPVIAVVLAIVVAACEHSTAPVFDKVDPIPDTVGVVAVHIDVAGDPSTTSSRFMLQANDSTKGYALLGGTRKWYAPPGTYRITMKSDAPFSQTWCETDGASEGSVTVVNKTTSTLTLRLTCPPISGTTTIRILGSASGNNPPDVIEYQLVRLNGKQVIQHVEVRVGEKKPIILPTGLYDVSARRPAGCIEPAFRGVFGVLFPVYPRSTSVIARRDQTVDATFTLRCA